MKRTQSNIYQIPRSLRRTGRRINTVHGSHRWPVVARVSAVLLLIMQINGIAQTRTDSEPKQGPDETERLQKAVQNPLANIVNVPFQYNGSFPIGPFSR